MFCYMFISVTYSIVMLVWQHMCSIYYIIYHKILSIWQPYFVLEYFLDLIFMWDVYPDQGFSWFSSILPGKCYDNTVKQALAILASFLIHHWVILPFDAT
jgi:hypothetical protein